MSSPDPANSERGIMDIRRATETDLDALAQLWHDGWVEAHAKSVPIQLVRLRTLSSFRERLSKLESGLRMVGTTDIPLGFCITKGDELDQLYVSPDARGTGLASKLLSDGEARLKASGIETAKLLCEPNNRRAARFYEKSGWTHNGVHTDRVDTSDGPFELDVIVFRKKL